VADRVDGMPVDVALIERLRAELLDEITDDYVSLVTMLNAADRLAPELGKARRRELVVETLATLIDHPDVKVVTGDMRRTFRSADALRADMAEIWPTDGELPESSTLVWVLDRNEPDG
jgi:hypothetical protein